MTLTVIYITFFSIVCGYLFYLFLGGVSRQKALIEATGPVQRDKKSLVMSLFYPVFKAQSGMFKVLKFAKTRYRLHQKFTKAAIAESFTPEIFWSFQVFSAILFLVLYILFVYYLIFLDYTVSHSLILCGVFLLAGFFFPYLWLSLRTKKRGQEIIFAFPDFVTTLTLSVEAGLDFFAAMIQYTANTTTGPLKTEIEKVISEVKLGSSRETALKNLALRVQTQAVTSFVGVLVQATQLGTSIGKVLRAQAEKLRRERFEAAERAGAMASQKILFPLVFFIMPAVFLLIFGPLIVRLMTGGFEGMFL